MFSGFNFGGGGKSAEDVSKSIAKEEPDVQPTKTSSGGAGSVHGFDPKALERAARAAKDLDSSKNSKEALRLITTQETTKQKEHDMERAKYQAMQQELAIRRVKEEEEAAARTLGRQSENEKARLDYKDSMDRKRAQDVVNSQRRLNEDERKKNEEAMLRQEQIKMKTLEYESDLRHKSAMERIQKENEGQILRERKNHDLVLEKTRVEGAEYRDTVLKGISLASSSIGNGFMGLVGDREKLANVASTLTVVAFGIYTARVSTGVIGRYIEARLGKPSLVRETTKKNILQMMRSPISTLKLAFGGGKGDAALKEIILEPTLDRRLRRVAVSTSNTKKNNAPYRHLLLHGPPGTGKTMFAKGLARESGLHYAIMTGGDVAPLGKEAVTEIHKLFDWANTTNKGVLLFVDEADAFLRKRSTEKISEDMRNALNAFLYRTGEASQKFMIVYASNQPEQFDWAINDRIDEMVEFKLPGFDERLGMISSYMDKYLLNPSGGSKQITVTGIDEALLRSVASLTENYSGREISKLAIAWQAAAYGTEDATLSSDLLMQVLHESKDSKVQKTNWLKKEVADDLVRDSSSVV